MKRQNTRVLANQESMSHRSSDDYVGRAEFQKLLKDRQRLLSQLEECRDRLAKAEKGLADQPIEDKTDARTSSVTYRNPRTQPQKKQSRSVGFDVCRRCGMKGHWA